MSNNKIIFDAHDAIWAYGSNEDIYPVIIEYKTGIFYTTQSNGMMCCHPEIEGFILGRYLPEKDFPDDCSLLRCCYGDDKDKQKAATAINNYLVKEALGSIYRIRFDFARVYLLTEGFWPILTNINAQSSEEMEGFLCAGNCD